MLMSKSEAAKEALGKISFDTALPQGWVNRMHEMGYEVLPNFVWAYPPGCLFGIPYPVTKEGVLILAKANARILL